MESSLRPNDLGRGSMVPVSVSLVSDGNLNSKNDDGHSKKLTHPFRETSERIVEEEEPGLFLNSSNHHSRNKVGSNTRSGETAGAKTSRGKFLAGVLFGHAPNADEILGSFSSSGAAIAATFLQSLLYSISSTVFASNLLSGMLILVSMSWSAPYPSVVPALVSCISGILTSLWILRFPRDTIVRGSITFNCFLFGSLISPLTGLTFSLIYHMIYLILIASIAGALIVFIWGGLNGILVQAHLPVLSAPTNLLAVLLISSGMKDVFHTSQEVSSTLLSNKTLAIHEPERLANLSDMIRSTGNIQPIALSESRKLDWMELFQGVIFSQGQIFQTTDSLVATWMVWLSVFIYSPILCLQEFIGASIGTLMGWVVMTENSRKDVFDGTWGFNPMLTSGALGGLFIAYDAHSVCLAVVASLLTSMFQTALWKNGFPVLGIPCVITIWIILPLVHNYPGRYEFDSVPAFQRVLAITTPELGRECCKGNWVTFGQAKSKYLRPKSSVLPL